MIYVKFSVYTLYLSFIFDPQSRSSQVINNKSKFLRYFFDHPNHGRRDEVRRGTTEATVPRDYYNFFFHINVLYFSVAIFIFCELYMILYNEFFFPSIYLALNTQVSKQDYTNYYLERITMKNKVKFCLQFTKEY